MPAYSTQKTAEESGLSMSEIESYLDFAKQAARIGGGILMENYGNLVSIKNKGRIGDLVTNADTTSEEAILKYLKQSTPKFKIIAEESGTGGQSSNLAWSIDPLDGTTNYAHGFPFFAPSIGLMWKNKPLLGAISVPFFKELYWAAPGVGSFCNDSDIKVSGCERLDESLLVTGFAYDRQTVIDNNYAEYCWLTHRTRGVRRAGAAAVDLAFVAAGRLDGYWERGLSPWDLTAGVAIVDIAGGKVSDYKSDTFCQDTGRVLACTPGIEKELKTELKKVRPLSKDIYDQS